MELCSVKVYEQISLNFSKHDLYKWRIFSIGYQLTGYGPCHSVLPFCFGAQILIRWAFQMFRDANSKLLRMTQRDAIVVLPHPFFVLCGPKINRSHICLWMLATLVVIGLHIVLEENHTYACYIQPDGPLHKLYSDWKVLNGYSYSLKNQMLKIKKKTSTRQDQATPGKTRQVCTRTKMLPLILKNIAFTDTLDVVGSFKRNIKNDTFLYISLISDAVNFSSITLHARVALKLQYMFVIRARPFPANHNVQYNCFHCS